MQNVDIEQITYLFLLLLLRDRVFPDELDLLLLDELTADPLLLFDDRLFTAEDREELFPLRTDVLFVDLLFELRTVEFDDLVLPTDTEPWFTAVLMALLIVLDLLLLLCGLKLLVVVETDLADGEDTRLLLADEETELFRLLTGIMLLCRFSSLLRCLVLLVPDDLLLLLLLLRTELPEDLLLLRLLCTVPLLRLLLLLLLTVPLLLLVDLF